MAALPALFLPPIALLLAGCSQAPPQPDASATAVASPRAAEPLRASTPPPRPAPRAAIMSGCEPPPRVSGAALAAEWPRRIGQRIRLKARVEQALDVTRVIATAGGHRFAVMVAPDAIWTGDREVVLTILGATTVLIAGGPQRVPELIHASDPCDDAAEAP